MLGYWNGQLFYREDHLETATRDLGLSANFGLYTDNQTLISWNKTTTPTHKELRLFEKDSLKWQAIIPGTIPNPSVSGLLKLKMFFVFARDAKEHPFSPIGKSLLVFRRRYPPSFHI